MVYVQPEAVPRDVMRDLLSDTLSRVMSAKVEAVCNAAYGSRTGERERETRMAASLDEQVYAFRGRTLEKAYPYVWRDALYLKVGEGGRTVSKAVLVATGVADSPPPCSTLPTSPYKHVQHNEKTLKNLVRTPNLPLPKPPATTRWAGTG